MTAAELRQLDAAATPAPWDGAEEPEFVGIFQGEDGPHIADMSHANAALVIALRNNVGRLADALEMAQEFVRRRTMLREGYRTQQERPTINMLIDACNEAYKRLEEAVEALAMDGPDDGREES